PDTLILFVLDPDTPPPFGRVFDTQHLFTRMFGVTATFWNFADNPAMATATTAEGVVTHHYGWPVKPDGSISLEPTSRFDRYDHLVAFRVARDGTLSLLLELPSSLLPPGCGPTGYDPLARIQPGPVPLPPFFRYASWMQR